MGNEKDVFAELVSCGLIAGLFFGIFFVKGITPTKEDGLFLFSKQLCSVVAGTAPTYHCYYLAFVSILFPLVGAVPVMMLSSQLEHPFVGFIVYGLGFLVGLFFMIYGLLIM